MRPSGSLEGASVQILLQLSLPSSSAHAFQYAVRVVLELQIRITFAANQTPESHLLGRHNNKLPAVSERVKREKGRSKRHPIRVRVLQIIIKRI